MLLRRRTCVPKRALLRQNSSRRPRSLRQSVILARLCKLCEGVSRDPRLTLGFAILDLSNSSSRCRRPPSTALAIARSGMKRRAACSDARAARGWLSPALWLLGALLVIQSFPTSTAVKRHDFKTCDQSGFCRRNRALADRAGKAGASWQSPYEVHTPEFSRGSFRAAVSNALFPQIKFSLEIRFQQDGTARVLMDEVEGLRQRYNEAAKWTLVGEPALEENDGRYEADVKETHATIKFHGGQNEARIDYKPLTITFFRDGQPHIVLNERKLFNMEHFRVKTVGKQPEELVVEDPEHPDEQLVVVQNEAFPGFLPPTEDGMWEETFGGKTDNKPKGTRFRGLCRA